MDRTDRLADDVEFQTQLADVRARLLRDTAPAGIDDATVQQAIDETVTSFEAASVRSFLTVLIERDVRRRLSLGRPTEIAPTRRDAGSAVEGISRGQADGGGTPEARSGVPGRPSPPR